MSATIHTIGEWAEAQRICDLPGVDEAIRGLLEDQTGDNAAMLVREVMRAITEGAAATLAQVSKVLAVNGKEPLDAADIIRHVTVSTRMNRELGSIIHDLTVANQAAWIEWKHGDGAEAGMQWVENGLAGPGMIPGEDDDDDGDNPLLKNAQDYFDRHSSWHMDGKPDGTVAGKMAAAKNDRELLDFVEANLVTVKAGNVPALVGDDIDKEFSVIQYHADEPRERVIGYASTARDALRAAVRALDPQADLFPPS